MADIASALDASSNNPSTVQTDHLVPVDIDGNPISDEGQPA